MEDWMNDPELSQLPPMTTPASDLKGLAARESAIPSHYALSLSDIKAQRTAQTATTAQTAPTATTAPTAQTATTAPTAPTASPQRAPIIESVELEELTEQGVTLFRRVAELVRRIAERGDSMDHSALESLALRLETLQPKRSTPTRAEQRSRRQRAFDVARELRDEGKTWAQVASALNARGYRGKRGQKWQGASIRQATLRDEGATDED
jgi:hypothetical protein